MMRLPKLIAVLLALSAGASGGVTSLAACPHAPLAVATTHTRHDCCHAAHTHAATHAEMSEPAAHHATHDHTADAQARVHRGGNCAAKHDANATQPETVGDGCTPCAGCCTDRAPAQPRTLTSAGAQKSKRSDNAGAVRGSHPLASTLPLHTAFTPTQHAPPRALARLHILISVLLI
jgi:hypothetical protein